MFRLFLQSMKTSLSDYEQKLVADAEILITKNIIIQKVYELFGKLAEDYQVILRDAGLTGTNELHPKYRVVKIMVDYPMSCWTIQGILVRKTCLRLGIFSGGVIFLV
jgi:hypothetical protein